MSGASIRARAIRSLGALRPLLLAPWWFAQLFSSAKSFRDNPLLGSPALNAWGLHALRLRLAHALTWRRRHRLGRELAPEDRAAFERDGFVLRHDFLPPATFDALRTRLLSEPAPAREVQQGDTVTRRIAIDPDLLATTPELRTLLDDPTWRRLTRYVAGYWREPWLYVQTILNRMHDAPADPQTSLHADTFHPTMKAWLFLTDVAEDEGAFSYVPGSHRLTPQRLAWERALSVRARGHDDLMTARGSFRVDEAELPALGLPPPRVFAVPANTLVVADTFGFHARGPSVRPSIRIELWAYDRRNPFLPWWTDGPLALLGQLGRRAPLYWEWMDRREAWGWGRNPWRRAGQVTPGSPTVASQD